MCTCMLDVNEAARGPREHDWRCGESLMDDGASCEAAPPEGQKSLSVAAGCSLTACRRHAAVTRALNMSDAGPHEALSVWRTLARGDDEEMMRR